MTLEVLMSCMHQKDAELVNSSRLTGDVVMINQCNREDYGEYPTENGMVRLFSTRQRGLTRSRNMAIKMANADICLLCDDDEVFFPEYEKAIIRAYEENLQADLICFKIANWHSSFPDRVRRLRFPLTMKISSIQLSFRRDRLLAAGVRFDELLGAGTGNGAEEELKFLLDCEKAGLRIYYVPVLIASVAQEESTWFVGFTEEFFENRGATTRYILGPGMASLYAVYYIIRKRSLYRRTISSRKALRAVFRGILDNKIGKQAKQSRELEF